MFKFKKRALTLILAVSLLLGSFADVLGVIDFRVFAAGEHNYIANNSDDAIRTVAVQTGGDDYIEVRALTDVSPYGRAFSLYPKAEDADSYYVIADLPTQTEWKIGKTQGIAFYVKLPEVSVSTLKVRLRLNGADVYAADIAGGKVGYHSSSGETKWEALSAQNGVLTGKSGFEGFVFIPYSAFQKDSAALTAAYVAQSTAVQLMLAVASNAVSDYQKDYVFDELGFYEGADSYVRAVTVSYGTEYVANSGENAKETVKYQWNCTDGQITYSQRNDAAAAYGQAIGLKIGGIKSGWNEFKTGIVVKPQSTWDISATTGYAFYCELPDVGADTAMDIWWYINDDIYWNELQQGKPIYYIADGSAEMETVTFSWGDYSLPGHDHGGFKGFIFVPFSSLKTRYNGKDRNYINGADYFEMRVGIARRPDQEPDLAEQTFVFDEIGLYTDPFNYIEAVKAKSCIGEYEIIANDGSNAASTVKLPSNYDGVTVTQEEVGISPYGASIGVTTKASGWNVNKTGIVLDSGDKNLSMSNGIAFYVKAPDVGELDTALDVWLWNTDRYCWNALVPGSNIYYIAQGSTAVTAVEFRESEYTYTLHDKSGFEGFVFIPFESFRCTWSDNKGKDLELIRERTRFEVRFNVAKLDAGLSNQTFVFDELGFYRDPVSYVAAVQKHREEPKRYNAVGNDGSNVSETVSVPDALGGGKVVVSQLESGVTPYGEAMKMTLGASGWNSEKVRVSLNVPDDFNMASAEGFAFYVKAPAVDAATDPCMDILFYKNDSQFWQSLQDGKPIYYLEKGSDTVTSEIFSNEKYTYPLSYRAGFEGFVFIPFDTLKLKYGGNDRNYINEAKNLQIWFNPVRTGDTHPKLAGQTYIFDEFGFYSDPLSYAEYCFKEHGSDVKGMDYLSNTGTDSTKAHICGSTDTITVSQLDEAVKMGMAYTVYPTKEGANNYWTEFNLPKQSDWDITRTEGIAFYAKIPQNSGKGLQVMLYLDDGHFYNDPYSGRTFYYMAKGTDRVEEHIINGWDYPFAGKSEWEGWFFLPYDAMQKNGSTASAASVAAAENVSLRISIISTDTADYNKNYVIDELGYYSDPTSYAKYVKSFYVDKSANYIANDGSNAADTVIAQWDMTDQIAVAQSQLGVSPYGASISMTIAGSGWNMYKTGYVLDVEEGWDLSATGGIAFYLQIPMSDIDPALDFLLFINNNDYWYGSLSDAKIYYLADGSDTLTEDYATNLIGHNMQGFCGFVFVPFDSFKGMSGKRSVVNNATRFEWRLNSSQTDKSLLGKTYVLDELGFYSDPIAYAEKAREMHGSYEYVVNDASDSSTFKVTDGGEEFLSVVQSSKGQPFSNAIVVTPVKSGFEAAGVEIQLKREPFFDLTKNNGIGFYVNVPSDINASGVTVTFAADGKSYSGTVSGKKIYYIKKNGNSITSSDAADGILKGKSGFEGFVFIPFDAIKDIDRKVIENAAEWQLKFVINADSKAIDKKYVFDEIGFYGDPAAYARPVKDTAANYIAESFNDLSAMYATNIGTELHLVSNKTPYGSAMSVVPTKLRSDNTWDHLNIYKDSSWNLENTEGIAMYVRMPGGISETQVTVMLYLNDNEFYPNNTGPVYYVPKNSDGSVVRVSSRQTLYDKVGFEGFVFIPYSSLTAHDGGKVDVSALQQRNSFQIRISHYRLNEDELNKDFIFDEIGFYSDRQMYIDAVRNKYGITDSESDGNYVANHGSDVDLTSVLRDGNSFTAVETDNRNSPFGTAIAVTDTSLFPEWHSIRLGTVLDTENNTAAKKAEGIAFYARFPDKVEDTCCNLILYADEYHSYSLTSGYYEDETPYTADYVTVGLDGKRKVVKAKNALENLQGFEGYIFIPYTSLRDTSDITKTAADSIDYIANSRTEIRFTREFSSKDSYNRLYVVDELGFYKTESDYIALAETFKDSAAGNISGNKITNSCASADGFSSEDKSALSVSIVGDKTSTGMSAEVISRYAEDDSTAAVLSMNTQSFLIKNAKGVAFYTEAPKAVKVTFVLKINDTLSYKATKSIAAGYKGIVYIPFEAFSDDTAKMTAALDMSYTLEARLIQAVESSGVGAGYIYDSIGFYADREAYKSLIESSFDETNDSIGNYPYTLDQLEIRADSNLKTKINNDSDTGIEVLDVTPENSIQQKLTFKISRAKSELWQLSKGITFFVDMSQGGIDITSFSLMTGEQESVLNSGEIKVLPLADEYSAPVSANSLSALDGKTAFVFIPFESFSPAVEATVLASVDSAMLTIGISGSGKTVSIGGVGLYGGERAYVQALRNVMGYGNYILNNGEQLSSWTVEDDGMYAVSVNGKSPSGGAVALVPETAGTDHFANALLETADGIEKTLGLAFYFNVPAGMSSTDMGISLQLGNTEYWEYSAYAPIYYAQSTDSDIFTVKRSSVMNGMQGTKSYVFIPFSSMKRTYTDGNKQVTEELTANASKYLKNTDTFKLIINNNRSNAKDTHYEYIFDTVGLYSDITSYLEAAGKTATVSYVTSAGYAPSKSDLAETKLHVINTLDSVSDVAVKGGAAAPATVNGEQAISVKPNGAFEVSFSSDLYGAKEAKSADGIMLWIETPDGVADPALTVTLTDKNGKKYTFNSGDYYYYCPDEGDRIVAMSGKLSLAQFAGNVIIPFQSFDDGRKLSFIDIKNITVSGGAVFKRSEIILQKAYAYPSLDFLRMSLGDLAERYTVAAATGSNSVVVSKDVIRLHDTSLSYAKLLESLKISPSAFSLALPGGVKSSQIASGKITLDVMRGNIKVGSIRLEVIEEDIVSDTLIIITPEVPAVPDRQVTVTKDVLIEDDEFVEEDKPVNELIRVKEAAASLVRLEGNTVTVRSVMTPDRLISAFAVADGAKLYIADDESYLVEGDVGVYDGYYLIVEYNGTKTGFKISAPVKPAENDGGFNFIWIIIIAAAVVIIAAVVVLLIIIGKKRKRKTT